MSGVSYDKDIYGDSNVDGYTTSIEATPGHADVSAPKTNLLARGGIQQHFEEAKGSEVDVIPLCVALIFI